MHDREAGPREGGAAPFAAAFRDPNVTGFQQGLDCLFDIPCVSLRSTRQLYPVVS